ncbi:hypothetical protein F5B22DRAFT_527589 [Xylaria bambusicola]|uniref:uncharacterized protein n=1 Tax=Xylaria bambusicola TaxID=326684 RepID=UPI002007D80B|nr:uncharacterized protein F5B22DRAFT_527589 [Xylaria bambusicola]KAI0505410.1 hypothetical protein F5B22DRAFT_527589 [Xylaria bambusicola]
MTEWLKPTAGPQGALPLIKRTTIQARAEPDWNTCNESPGPDGILWPQARDDGTQQATRAILERRKLALGHDYIEFRANDLDFTAFYYVYNMGPVALAYFNSAEVPSVLLAYYPSNPYLPPGVSFKRDVPDESSLNETYMFDEPTFQERSTFQTWNDPVRKLNREESDSELAHSDGEVTFDAPSIDIRDNVEILDVTRNVTDPVHFLGKRTVRNWFNAAWHLSMVTWPPTIPFNVARDVRDHGNEAHDPDHDPDRNKYAITADDSWGRGQTVYIMDSGWDRTAAEYSARADELPFKTYGKMPDQSNQKAHGTRTTAFAAGAALGMAKNARVRFAQVPTKDRNDKTPSVNQGEIVERFLEALINIANDAATQPKNTCVVNMSWGITPRTPVRAYWSIFLYLMQAMESKYGCVFVAAPGNSGMEARHYPALFWDRVPGMFVAGAVDLQGFPFSGNAGEDIINIYAPGVKVPLGGGSWVTGTSYAAPIVSGFVAYLRGLPQYTGGRDPTSIRAKIQEWARPISIDPLLPDADTTSGYNILWNGQRFGTNCVSLTKRSILERQFEGGDEVDENGGSCPIRGNPSSPGNPGNPGNPSNPGGDGPQGPPVEYKSGEPGPICSTNCGKLCSGFYCNPTPSGTPPDFTPPRTTTKPTPTPAPTACTGFSTLHTTTICNGDPRGGSCKTSTLCEDALPTLPPHETPPPFPSNCVSTATWTSCALGVPPGVSACITGSSCAATSMTPDPTPTPTPSTWSPPYGLPTPRPIPDASPFCIEDNCGLYPSIMDACDKAAEVFIKFPDDSYGTGEDDFVGSCVDGHDKSNGKPVGCALQFLVREGHHTICHFTGQGAAQWYSNLRSSCETCGLLESEDTGCTLLAEFVETCDGVFGKHKRSLQ